ncbi:MAG TPA: MBOAT family O-acyltransferase [Planctomycetota bacterium]|nr:MBOAT family O-acyltransferase [Planctomycetota bacterium]
MLFHSIDFLVFFAVVFPVYLLLRRTRYMNAWLLLSSYFFYSWWNPLYLLLIIGTTIVDFFVVRRMEQSSRKKAWLSLSLISNLGALAFFKYIRFFTENLNAVLSLAGVPLVLPVLDPVLPLGISFFTFQSLSYAIDVYRGDFPAEQNLVRYATYVSFFPQMIAGPICRAGSLIPQLRTAPPVTMGLFTSGASLFLTGLFKKVAIADWLGMYVDRVYQAPENFQSPALIMGTFAFAWQIYFDFSGYTDMARGVARAMGFHLTRNFNAPYTASDLGEFWGRWNITVSTWFRDYVYIPLGGNREGHGKTIRNILLTMVTSGVWHGASWSFVLWGLVHGVGRVATRELGILAWLIGRMPRLVQQAGVFVFVTFAWIFFRARNVGDGCLIVLRILSSGFADPRFPVLLLVPIGIVWITQLLENQETPVPRGWNRFPVRVGIAFSMIAYLAMVSQPSAQSFIYFNF